MRVRVDQASLLAVCRRAAACASSSSARFDERLLRIATAGDALRVSATDHMLAYEGVVEGDGAAVAVAEPGALLLDAKEFVARLSVMPAGLVTLGTLGPQSGKAAARAPGPLRATIRHERFQRAYTFPAAPESSVAPIRREGESQAKNLVDLTGDALARLVVGVAWAANPSEADPPGNAIQLTVDRDRMNAAAATSRSLAVAEARVRSHVDDSWGGALSLRGAKALVAFAQSVGAGELSLSASPQQLVAACGATRLGVALLVVAPRDLAGMLATLVKGGPTDEVVVPRKAFAEAVGAMRLAIDAASDRPGLYLAAAGAALHLVGEGAGDARDALPTATPITRRAWGQYLPESLLHAAQAAQGEDVSLAFLGGHGTPLLLTDTCAGVSLSALLLGMSKYRSATIDAILAEAGETP